jgi:septal ring factor EnvC (AmiA/AmiB activator)
LQQTQERKAQLEDEIAAYEERMKKLNMELKKLQGFQQQSEQEVRVWGWGRGRSLGLPSY